MGENQNELVDQDQVVDSVENEEPIDEVVEGFEFKRSGGFGSRVGSRDYKKYLDGRVHRVNAAALGGIKLKNFGSNIRGVAKKLGLKVKVGFAIGGKVMYIKALPREEKPQEVVDHAEPQPTQSEATTPTTEASNETVTETEPTTEVHVENGNGTNGGEPSMSSKDARKAARKAKKAAVTE
jgi:hypothetical protein